MTQGTELVEREQWAAEAADARAIEQRIKAAVADARVAAWDLAEMLWRWDEMRGWLRLGYETLGEWLADPEITMKRSAYYGMVGAWQRLVVERGVDPERIRLLAPSKVDVVLPAITAGTTTIDEGLGDAEALGEDGLRQKYRPMSNARKNVPACGTEGEQAVANDRPEARRPRSGHNPQNADCGHKPTAEVERASAARALADAKALPWEEFEDAIASGRAYPALTRPATEAFLSWRDAHLTHRAGRTTSPTSHTPEAVMEREAAVV